MKSKHDIASRLPSKLYEKLMPFQKDGVEFAVRKDGRCLIADEMGLGKTLQAISVAYYYRSEWPLLIIVPSSLRYSWIEEFEKWLPDISPSAINLIQTGNDASGIANAQVTITTFGLLSKSTSNIVREALLSQGFQVTIVDESHYIRNVKTASAKIVVPLIKNANRRILLSGTPALARPVELFPQIDAICPNGFGSWWAYTARYCDARIEWIGKIKKRNVNGASHLEELQQKLSQTLMIRRQKNEVLTQLPPKQRQKVLFELKDSDIKKDIRKTFEELRPLLKQGKTKSEAMEVLTGAAADPDVKDLNTLSLIQKLYQLSGEAKIGPAKEYIEMLCDNPNLKFLVFAYHHSMMNGLCQSLYDKKVKFIRIDGDTPPSERPQLVHQFQSDPNTRVAVLSILAAGVGLTFTAATVVVFAEMYWTPGMMVQCEDRAHRIGQTTCVAVHYLVAKDTMDEWVWSAVCKKTIVTSTTLTGKSQQMEADVGDKYQIDILSNAEAWIPKENENLDVSNFFSSQQESDQKSILEFFSPCQSSKRCMVPESQTSAILSSTLESSVTINSPSPKQAKKRQKLESVNYNRQQSKEYFQKIAHTSEMEEMDTPIMSSNGLKKGSVRSASKKCIVIDSGSDGEDFDTKHKQKNVSRKKSSAKSGKEKLRNGNRKGKRDILTMFSQSSNSQSTIDSVSDIDTGTSMNDSSFNQRTSSSANEKIDGNDCLTETPNQEIDGAGNDCGLSPQVLSTVNSAESSAKTNCDTSLARPGLSTEVKMISNQWSCSICTFLNHKDLVYCEMCETPKKVKTKSVAVMKKLQETEKAEKNLAGTEKTNKQPVTEDSRNTTAVELKPEVLVELSVNSLRQNNHCSKESENETSEKLGLPERKRKRYSNCLHDLSSSDEEEEPLQNLIENWNSEPEDNTDCKPIISDTKPTDSVKQKRKANGLEWFDSQMSRTLSQSGLNDFMDRKDGPAASISAEDSNNIEMLTEVPVKSENLGDLECTSPRPRISAEDNTQKRCVSKAFSTPKQYRFKSIDRSSGKSPLTPPPILNGCYSKEMAGSMLKKNNFCLLPSTPDTTGSPVSRVLSESGKKETDNKSSKHNDLKRTTGSIQKVPVGINSIDKSDIDSGGVEDEGGNDFSSPEMKDIYAGVDCETLEQTEQGETKQSVRRQLHTDTVSPTTQDRRVVNLENICVYSSFRYQCSKYTGRIYLLSAEDEPLNINFIPMDIEVGNLDDLPDLLLHQSNLRLVQRFVREWQSLTETKRRLIIKHGRTFISPLREYDELKSCKTVTTQRHRTKEDTALAAMLKAAEVDGTVRVISKETGQDHSEVGSEKGVTQAVGPDGIPLCLNCFQPYKNTLIQKSSVLNKENAWSTRFCSLKCSQEYWMKTNNDYCREKVYEAERGICQICGFDAHSLFKQVRDTSNLEKRAEVIAKSKLNALNPKTKQQMVKKPVAGQFWHVDHILPVWEGGGQCDIDNLRTLCITCHHNVTAKQAKKRAIVRRLGNGAGSRDITAFFQKN